MALEHFAAEHHRRVQERRLKKQLGYDASVLDRRSGDGSAPTGSSSVPGATHIEAPLLHIGELLRDTLRMRDIVVVHPRQPRAAAVRDQKVERRSQPL